MPAQEKEGQRRMFAMACSASPILRALQANGEPVQRGGKLAQPGGVPAELDGVPARRGGNPARPTNVPTQFGGALAWPRGVPVQASGELAQLTGSPARNSGGLARTGGAARPHRPHAPRRIPARGREPPVPWGARSGGCGKASSFWGGTRGGQP